MADETPGEANVRRDGPQLNIRDAQAVAAESGTVRGPAGQGHADRELLEAPVRDSVPTSNTANANVPDQPQFADAETAMGGADAVQKTTYGVGHGAEPDGTEEHAPVGETKGEGDVVSRVSPGGGVSPVAWVVAVIGALALVVYGFGAFRG